MSHFEDPTPGLAFDFPKGWLAQPAQSAAQKEDAGADVLTKRWLEDLDELEDVAAQPTANHPATGEQDDSAVAQGPPTVPDDPHWQPGALAAVALTALPDGVQGLILQLLSCQDLISVSLVCRSWHSISHQNSAWKPLYASAVLAGAHPLSDFFGPTKPAAQPAAQPAAEPQPAPSSTAACGPDEAQSGLRPAEHPPPPTFKLPQPAQPALNGMVIIKKHAPQQHGQHRALHRRFLKATTLDADEHPLGLYYHLTKSATLAVQQGQEFGSLWQVHDSMRLALCDAWEGSDSISILRCFLLKLTRYSWQMTYEALVVGFQHRADACALDIVNKPAGSCLQAVLAAWQKYSSWLGRVAGASGALAECVSAERAAEMLARARPQTPSISHAAQLAFRSQVLLAYQLRGRLQDELAAAAAEPEGPSRTWALDAGRMLEILDVADDTTLGAAHRTQAKFNRVFGMDKVDRGSVKIHGYGGARPHRRRSSDSFQRPQKSRRHH